MAKVVDFKCDNESCDYKTEEIFNDTEKVPQTLKGKCPKCGGKIIKGFNIKNNMQAWRVSGGL